MTTTGDQDIYLNNFGPNVLVSEQWKRNIHGCHANHRRGNGDHVGAGACFLDIDQDGDLDLYVANYIDFTLAKHQVRVVNGYPAYVGPMIYGPVPDTLFRNNGTARYRRQPRVRIAAHAGTGMGMVCADYDDDGDTDIIVGNDAMANFVWRNDGAGQFRGGRAAHRAGLRHARSRPGNHGVECGDYVQ